MNAWLPAFWAETLKARRSKVSVLTVIAFALFPLASGLFMIILKDPTAAQSMGLISMKAQLVAGTADWPTFFDMLLQSTAMAGPSCLPSSWPGSLGASSPIAPPRNYWLSPPRAESSSALNSC